MAPDGIEYAFQATPEALQENIDRFVDAVFSSLSSFYLELPRGAHFVRYAAFREAYVELAASSKDFRKLDPEAIKKLARTNGLVLVVLRCIVGLSPPELADLATETQGVKVDQHFARSQDQRARDGESLYARARPDTAERLDALIMAACDAMEAGPTTKGPMLIHRLDKIDTSKGLKSLRHAAAHGIEYAMLLYERLLGRPYASHRDSVSEEVGDLVEDAIVQQLEAAGIPFHRTGRAEKIAGFDQAPDFLIPDAANPKIIIEAKPTQDDGTARDKVTRVQHLDRLSNAGKRFEVIACIDGRGFKIRREDMKKLILATRGKVFSIATIEHLVSYTALEGFRKGK